MNRNPTDNVTPLHDKRPLNSLPGPPFIITPRFGM